MGQKTLSASLKTLILPFSYIPKTQPDCCQSSDNFFFSYMWIYESRKMQFKNEIKVRVTAMLVNFTFGADFKEKYTNSNNIQSSFFIFLFYKQIDR